MKPKQLFLSLALSMLMLNLYAQRTVTGTVISGEDNLPVIGATVLLKGTDKGTATDFDGRYSIEVPGVEAVLVFSYMGLQTREIRVGEQSTLDVTLIDDISELEEVVVVGYGVQKKAAVTGAISKIKSADLEAMPVMRVEQSLQGRTSGVRVTTNSGQPGAASTVRIRGTTSINDSEPLYVVDGVPVYGGIEYLSQSDIESIEVLKDAASGSIYGARSANGVILVTTKNGKKDQMQVNYNAYWGQQAPWRKLSLLNATEYATLANEASVAAGQGVRFENPAALGEGTDWQDAVFNMQAPIQSHELSLSAGSENSNYYVSFGYFNQAGIVAQNQSNFERLTLRFNSTHRISNRVSFGNTLGYTRVNGQGVAENTEFGSPLSRAINIDPLTPLLETDPEVLASSVFQNFPVVRDPNGVPYGISTLVTTEVVNPVAALAVTPAYGWSDKMVGNAYVEAKIIEGLNFRSTLGVDLAFWGNESFSPIYYLNATNRSDFTSYGRGQNRGLLWNWQNTLTYDRRFDKHNINLLLGNTAEDNSGEGISGAVQNVPVDNIDDASLLFPSAVDNQSFGGFEYVSKIVSYFGRVNYDYDSRYLLSASMRADGSSRFGANNRFGYFPSVSVGWVMSEEAFMAEKAPWLNFMKLRASWGVNGSDRIGDFRFVSTVGGGRQYTFGIEDQLVNGVSPNAIANPDLRWEETTQLNFGFDARVFKYFTVTFDYFDKLTSGMLLPIAVPGYVGNAGPIGNIADMSNRGWELELGYNQTLNNGLNLGLAGNLSYVQNEVTSLGEDKEFLPGQVFGPQALEITRTAVGLPVGFFFGYQIDGIFQNQAEVDAYVNSAGEPLLPNAAPGDFRFVDINNDGVIDADDRGMIGDPTPNWTYGFNFTAAYKGFDMVLFGQGVGGNQVFKAIRRFDLPLANWDASAIDRWTGEGTSNSFPRLVLNDPNQNFSRSSTFFLEDGSFFRIRTLQVGYTLPTTLSMKAGMRRLRFYVSGNNLLTLTKYSGFDPEIGGGSFGVDRGIYPQARFYLVGVNATF